MRRKARSADFVCSHCSWWLLTGCSQCGRAPRSGSTCSAKHEPSRTSFLLSGDAPLTTFGGIPPARNLSEDGRIVEQCLWGEHHELEERALEGCRIYAAALDVRGSNGFHAAVVVMTGRTSDGARTEVFRDDCLLDGRIWLDPAIALGFALQVGEAAIVGQRVLRDCAKAQTLPYCSFNQPETNPGYQPTAHSRPLPTHRPLAPLACPSTAPRWPPLAPIGKASCRHPR